jgi:uncharacterized protein (DUF488 family)
MGGMSDAAPAPARLFTIGYEGADIESVIDALLRAGVTTLVDVRDAPVSRKKGFSKKALEAALAGAGITYLHLRWLGNPRPGRDAGRAGDIPTYHRIYLARLATPEAQAQLAEAGRIADRGGACLMCYEHDPTLCHRTILADRLRASHGYDIENLFPSA